MLKRKKRQIKKALLCCSIITICTLTISGCSIFRREPNTPDYSITTVTDVNELSNGHYYVQRDGVYYELYLGQSTFGKGSISHLPNDNRVVWFGKDYDKIPTMYKGDSIVFCTSSVVPEYFYVERFEDLGYTIGICRMKQLTSGRYTFSTDSQRLNVNVRSSAGQVCSIGDNTAVLDKIGGAELRAGNISRAGTIVGLSKDKTYKCDIYVGTTYYEYKIVADVKAMVSMETVKLKDYTFTQSKTISFNLPSYFNSGYYYINGFGIVRYIAGGNSFSEEMDMNIPNTFTNTTPDTSETPDDSLQQGDANGVREENISVKENKTVTITVTYKNPDAYVDYEPPVAKLIGEYSAYTLSFISDGTLSGTYNLEPGEYTLQISGLAGRGCSYTITE